MPSSVVMPFGYGARICPGKDLATLEVIVGTARVLQRLRVSLPAGGHAAVGTRTAFTQEPDRDVELVFEPRARQDALSALE